MSSSESKRGERPHASVPFLRAVLRSAAALLLIAPLAAGSGRELGGQADDGRISGRVISSQDAEPLVGAQVFVPELERGVMTDVDGRYLLRGVPAGSHTLVVRYVGFATRTVTGVKVNGAPVVLDITMAPQAIEFEAITVTATRERGSNTALLTERMKAPVVVDAIGSEQISKSPDGDAASALKRVPGISIVDGRYVYVRGLGERYGNTTLNGAPLPSPEPDRKAVPLDLIPSSLLESVVTAKTYSPDQPGDFAGGLVQLNTRDFTGLRIFKLGTSLGYNTAASLRDGLGYRGGRYDFFGFDDGSRGLPGALPADRPVQSSLPAAELERIGESFAGSWAPRREKLPVNQGFGLTFGDEVELAGRPFSVLGSLTHSGSYSREENAIERVLSSAGGTEPEVDYRGHSTAHSVALGALLNLGYRIAPTSKLSLSTVYNRRSEDEARIYEGFNLDANADQRNSRLRYLTQTLLNSQLAGEHVLEGLGNTSVKWRGAYAAAGRYEPNTRDVLYRRAPDGRFLWENFIQSGSVFHQDMTEDGASGGVELKVPFELRSLPASFSFGASADARDRAVYTRRFRFLPDGVLSDSLRALPPDELLSPAHIGAGGFRVQEATFREDNYDAGQSVLAGYLMADAELLPRLRVVAGARVERARQTVAPRDLFAAGLAPVPGARLQATDVLPALNLTYAPGGAMNLRLGLSRTLARPQLRELAPFSFADYAGGYLVVGNPLLGRSRIRNYDLRWEWFPKPGALVAVSGFYKRFDDPIEVLVFPSTELIKSWINADRATNYGAEIELRSSLGFLDPALENVSANANLTLVRSQVVTGSRVELFLPRTGRATLPVTDDDRPLQGQSPYVLNAGLSYFHPEAGTSATVLYNRFGRRIDSVGGQTLPDAYEEARNQLDIVLEQPIPGGFTLKLSASRLLGSAVTFTQGGDVVRQYDNGRTLSVSGSWSPRSE